MQIVAYVYSVTSQSAQKYASTARLIAQTMNERRWIFRVIGVAGTILMANASSQAHTTPTLYFEELIDNSRQTRRVRITVLGATVVALAIDYLGSYTGDPFQPDIWLLTLPAMILAFFILPKIALWPHPYIRVGGGNIEIRTLRIPPRRIPVASIFQIEAKSRRGKIVVQLNCDSILSGDRFSLSRPYEFMDAIERAQRDLRATELSVARAEAPSFRSDAQFTFERRLSIKQALLSRRMLAGLGAVLFVGLSLAFDSEGLSFSWIDFAILLGFIALAVGAVLLRRNVSITVNERDLEIRGVYLRRRTLSTPAVRHAEATSSGLLNKDLKIRYVDKKERTLVIPVPDAHEAAATIRRALLFFSS